MTKRLTWEQIQEKYPDQWVGLVDVKYRGIYSSLDGRRRDSYVRYGCRDCKEESSFF